ncbi:MAG TPA: serine/threonine-protein kinase [Burkholderiales bacterium]|nr:serine/threonine-protein kinase [Burkholderiales bacterium]
MGKSKSELKSLGRYQIRGVLGKGAMGLVYDGHDSTLDRRVAIKTIQTSNLDEATAKHYDMRFRREVRAVARLNHPNIVQVYDFGSEGDLAFIVMEFIEGRELKDYLDAKERFDLARIFTLMGELLDALDFAHQAGVIHRDVKPANVMINAAGRAKLADFGVARITDDQGGEATRVGAMVGTPSHMSPEQIQGQQIDRRTDIFSAGIVLYQLLTGQKPFEGAGWALAKKIVQDDPVWPSQLVQIPPTLDRVIARALAKHADQRYQTARSFADDLKRVREGKAPEAAASRRSAASLEAEKEFWEGVKDSDDPDELELYLEQFPEGAFVDQARKKVAELRAKKGQ